MSSFVNSLPLPEKFLGVLPLYIGVELVLGVAILNKCSGIFGILSIFTGHPLDFIQWSLYITSIVVVPFYFLGLKNITKPKALEHAPILLIYSVDTLTSLLFILWFAAEWLLKEDVTIEQKPGENYSKSATQAYEYGWIIFTTLTINVSRFYFNLILLSFFKKLIRLNKVQGVDVFEDGDQLNLKNQPFYIRWNHKMQVFSYKFLEQKI